MCLRLIFINGSNKYNNVAKYHFLLVGTLEKEIEFIVLVPLIHIPATRASLSNLLAKEVVRLCLHCSYTFLPIRCRNSHDLSNTVFNIEL